VKLWFVDAGKIADKRFFLAGSEGDFPQEPKLLKLAPSNKNTGRRLCTESIHWPDQYLFGQRESETPGGTSKSKKDCSYHR